MSRPPYYPDLENLRGTTIDWKLVPCGRNGDTFDQPGGAFMNSKLFQHIRSASPWLSVAFDAELRGTIYLHKPSRESLEAWVRIHCQPSEASTSVKAIAATLWNDCVSGRALELPRQKKYSQNALAFVGSTKPCPNNAFTACRGGTVIMDGNMLVVRGFPVWWMPCDRCLKRSAMVFKANPTKFFKRPSSLPAHLSDMYALLESNLMSAIKCIYLEDMVRGACSECRSERVPLSLTVNKCVSDSALMSGAYCLQHAFATGERTEIQKITQRGFNHRSGFQPLEAASSLLDSVSRLVSCDHPLVTCINLPKDQDEYAQKHSAGVLSALLRELTQQHSLDVLVGANQKKFLATSRDVKCATSIWRKYSENRAMFDFRCAFSVDRETFTDTANSILDQYDIEDVYTPLGNASCSTANIRAVCVSDVSFYLSSRGRALSSGDADSAACMAIFDSEYLSGPAFLDIMNTAIRNKVARCIFLGSYRRGTVNEVVRANAETGDVRSRFDNMRPFLFFVHITPGSLVDVCADSARASKRWDQIFPPGGYSGVSSGGVVGLTGFQKTVEIGTIIASHRDMDIVPRFVPCGFPSKGSVVYPRDMIESHVNLISRTPLHGVLSVVSKTVPPETGCIQVGPIVEGQSPRTGHDIAFKVCVKYHKIPVAKPHLSSSIFLIPVPADSSETLSAKDRRRARYVLVVTKARKMQRLFVVPVSVLASVPLTIKQAMALYKNRDSLGFVLLKQLPCAKDFTTLPNLATPFPNIRCSKTEQGLAAHRRTLVFLKNAKFGTKECAMAYAILLSTRTETRSDKPYTNFIEAAFNDVMCPFSIADAHIEPVERACEIIYNIYLGACVEEASIGEETNIYAFYIPTQRNAKSLGITFASRLTQVRSRIYAGQTRNLLDYFLRKLQDSAPVRIPHCEHENHITNTSKLGRGSGKSSSHDLVTKAKKNKQSRKRNPKPEQENAARVPAKAKKRRKKMPE